MKISGTSTLQADPATVWRALNDPAVLVRAIPGCRALEAIRDTGAGAGPEPRPRPRDPRRSPEGDHWAGSSSIDTFPLSMLPIRHSRAGRGRP